VLRFVVCHVDGDICDGLITHSEESYRVCRVCEREREREIACNLEPSTARRSRTDLGCCYTDK